MSVSLGGSLRRHRSTPVRPSQAQRAGRSAASQDVSRGFVFDATGGYQITTRIGAGPGHLVADSGRPAAITVLVPDPPVFRPVLHRRPERFRPVAIGDRLRLQVLLHSADYRIAVGLTFSGGPSIIHVKQEVATATVAQDSTTGDPVRHRGIEEATGKAGNVGVDVSYRIGSTSGPGWIHPLSGWQGPRCRARLNLSVGGAQIGAGVPLPLF